MKNEENSNYDLIYNNDNSYLQNDIIISLLQALMTENYSHILYLKKLFFTYNSDEKVFL